MASPPPPTGQSWYQANCADLIPKQLQPVSLDSRKPNAVAYAVFARAAVLWDNGSVNVGTTNQQNKVNKYISEWSKYAGVTFSLVDAAATPGPMIRISFDSTTGNWSILGSLANNTPPSQATMNLGWVYDSADEQPYEKGVILHEVGHALGLAHEFSGFPLDATATKAFYGFSQGWSDSDVQENILDVYNSGKLSNYQRYDRNSVMNCFVSKDMDVEGRDVYPNDDLSDHDKAFMVINYPRSQLDPNAREWTLSHALDVMDVPGFDKHAMLLARPDDVRKQFAIWSAERLSGGGESTRDPGPGRAISDATDNGNKRWFRRACTDLSSAATKPLAQTDPGMAAHAVLAKSALLWENGKNLTYSFLNGTQIQKDKVNSVIPEWTKYANVKFTLVASGGILRISFNSNDGSWSWVGKESLSVPRQNATMNLGWVDGTSATLTADELGVILHEFGHTLGLLHEHQSPARGGTITLNESNVYNYYMSTQGWSRELVKTQIINPFDLADVSNYSQLDLHSIMMYYMPKEMNLEGIEVKVNNALTDLDKAYMAINYPFQTKDSTWTLAHALDVAGVTGFSKETILGFTSADDIRQSFTVWTASARAALASAASTTRPGGGEGRGPGRGVEAPNSALARAAATLPSRRCGTDKHLVTGGDGQVVGGPSHAAAAGNTLLWTPGLNITYFFQNVLYRRNDEFVQAFDQGKLSEEDKDYRIRRLAIIRAVFREWSEISGLTFEEVLREDGATVHIFIDDEKDDDVADISTQEESWCCIGKEALTETNIPSKFGGYTTTTMYLLLPDSDDYTDQDIAEALRECRHEFGHMLGLRHEHASPLSPAIAPIDKATGLQETTEGIEVWTDYDPMSIMLYSGLDLKSDAGERPTKRQKKELTAKTWEISPRDKSFVKALYARDLDAMLAAVPALGLDAAAVARIRAKGVKGSAAPWNLTIRGCRDQLAAELRAIYGGTKYTKPQDVNPTGPARGVEATVSSTNVTKGDFLDQIVESLKQFFNPGGNQTFALQFPGRFLQISQYAWDTGSAGVYGQFIKPIAVNESEFRLTDQLYEPATVVGGPNGILLSQVYDQLLNNLLPVFRSNGLAQQQDQIRQWLLREVKTAAWIRQLLDSQHSAGASASVDDTVDVDDDETSSATIGKPAFAISNKLENGTVNRMELSNALMQEYLQAKQAWEVERDGMIQDALELQLGTQESKKALDNLTRKLAHTTATREAQLAAKYSDAVVRGYTHNVREYVGYLDVKSAAEALQDAKDSLREAAMSSLDGSLKVYPVQMTPIDWFEGLSTSFKLEDLTQDPDLIYQQIRAKSRQLDTLQQQLASLRLGVKGNPDALRAGVAAAQANLDKAQADLALKYSSNVIAMVKTCYASDGGLIESQVKELVDGGDIVGVVADQVIADMAATSAAQTTLTQRSRAYTQALAGYALAQATDTQQQQEQIRLQVESLTSDIDELTARYTSLNKPSQRPQAGSETKELKDVGLFPVTNDTAGGSRWQQIEMHHEVESDYTTSSDSADATQTSMHANLWLLSASSSQSTVTGTATSFKSKFSNIVDIGFRATLVTVDRAGWFQPQFFKQSGSFYHIDPAVSWSKESEGSQPLLPAFPVGYVICKDITIKISTAKSDGKSFSQDMSADSSASGGVLCFSYSQSSSSSASENSYSFQQCANGCIIRIPGPQILGYILQNTDPDKTTNMPKQLPSDFFIPEADYDAATADTGDTPSHAVNPDQPVVKPSGFLKEIDEILKKSNVSSKAMEAVHQAMQKEFDVLSDEVATRVKQG